MPATNQSADQTPHDAERSRHRRGPFTLALDLGTTTGWALQSGMSKLESGSVSLRTSRYDGGGVRYLRFRGWLDSMAADAGDIAAVYFEEVRRHIGTDAAHVYGGLLATLGVPSLFAVAVAGTPTSLAAATPMVRKPFGRTKRLPHDSIFDVRPPGWRSRANAPRRLEVVADCGLTKRAQAVAQNNISTATYTRSVQTRFDTTKRLQTLCHLHDAS